MFSQSSGFPDETGKSPSVGFSLHSSLDSYNVDTTVHVYTSFYCINISCSNLRRLSFTSWDNKELVKH